MKRKIAAIMTADIAGYSKLVAEDEEETLRRLESYRGVFADFVTRFSGRIFNTAGDAILAEFPSAVDAVRCAIDVQESLRTRNLAYPASRQMSFRIGITIGDVVERDGDLLGDGVNIASRLSGLAAPGGLCVARTVHEQVANKLSVTFVDIGEREVKNIPTPIHVYALVLGGQNPRVLSRQKKDRSLTWPVAVTAASIAAVAVAGAVLLHCRSIGGPGGGRRVARDGGGGRAACCVAVGAATAGDAGTGNRAVHPGSAAAGDSHRVYVRARPQGDRHQLRPGCIHHRPEGRRDRQGCCT